MWKEKSAGNGFELPIIKVPIPKKSSLSYECRNQNREIKRGAPGEESDGPRISWSGGYPYIPKNLRESLPRGSPRGQAVRSEACSMLDELYMCYFADELCLC